MRHKPDGNHDLDVSLRDVISRVSDVLVRAPREVAKEDLRAVVEKNKKGFEAAVAKLTENA